MRANVPFLNEKGQGASGGMYFNIDRKTDAEKAPEGYYAQYDFNIPAPGAYHVWIAATPFNAGWASPCSIRWDNEPAIDLAGRRPYSPPYGFDHPRAYFFWTKAGVKNFTKAGKHTLRVIADRPRGNTDNIRVFLDAIALTADPAWAPRGNRPPGSPWKGVPKGATPEERKANFRKAIYDIQMQTYPAKLAETNEEWNPETTAEVLRKMKARPLPAPSAIGSRKQLRFGLHGIEKPFVQAGADEERTAAALDLLARAGVEFLRTAEPCWHRLGNVPGTFDYRQLDYEMSLARKHGMKLMLTMGFAPAQYGKGRGNKLAACKPEYYGLYRDYLDDLFRHVPEEMIHSVELANEGLCRRGEDDLRRAQAGLPEPQIPVPRLQRDLVQRRAGPARGTRPRLGRTRLRRRSRPLLRRLFAALHLESAEMGLRRLDARRTRKTRLRTQTAS